MAKRVHHAQPLGVSGEGVRRSKDEKPMMNKMRWVVWGTRCVVLLSIVIAAPRVEDVVV